MKVNLKIASAVLGTLLLAGAALLWARQQTQLEETRTENETLRAQTVEIQQMRTELERLRKVQIDPAEVTRLQAVEAKHEREVAQLRSRIGELLRNQASASSTQVNIGASGTQSPSSNRGTSAGVRTAAGDWMKTVLGTSVDAQIARARERLQLTPDQEQNLRSTVDQAFERGRQDLQRVLTGQATAEEVPSSLEWAKSLEKQVLATLTPEQQASYFQYKKQDIQANARLIANGELLSMQNTLTLTEEQQDQVFGALYIHSVGQLDPDDQVIAQRPKAPLAAAEWDMERKTQALEGVLTPEQLESYRKIQNSQLQFWKSLSTAFSRPTTK